MIKNKKKSERDIVANVFQKMDANQDIGYFRYHTYKYIKKLGNKLYGTVYLVEDQTDFKK